MPNNYGNHPNNGGAQKQRIRLRRYKPQIQNENPKVHLRRPSSKQHIIAKNLQTLQENARKKKVAQEIYYNSKLQGRSPLKRYNQGNQNNRSPVHNRLGNKVHLRRNKQPNVQVKPNMLKNKKGFQNRNHNKIIKMQVVQNRLGRNKVNNRMQNTNLQGKPQKIRLRRNKQPIRPMNYTVQVKNNSLPTDILRMNKSIVKHHPQLNPRLQAEIKMIQKVGHQVKEEISKITTILPSTSGITKTTLNERFSHL